MAITIKLTHEMEYRLTQLVKATGRSKAFYLKEIVNRSLDDLEDYYLAANSQAMIASQTERVFEMDQVRAELDLDR